MPCLAAPKIGIDLPTLALYLPDLTFSVPDLSITFCCTLETPPIPGFPIILPIGSLDIPGLAIIIQAAMSVINTAIDFLNALLDQIAVDCPFDA